MSTFQTTFCETLFAADTAADFLTFAGTLGVGGVAGIGVIAIIAGILGASVSVVAISSALLSSEDGQAALNLGINEKS